TSDLRAVATNIASTEASARVEAALISAFRQRTETPLSPTAQPAYRALSGWAPLAIAATAAFLVVSVFGVSRLLFNGSGESSSPQEAHINQQAPVSSPLTAPQVPESSANGIQPATAMNSSEPILAAPPRLADRSRAQRFNAVLNNRARNMENFSAAANEREEITTDFLPLTYGGLSQMDGGQVVRLEVPRSALQSLGLPINVERAGERVKADVLVGNDGVARAIRFVR